MSAGQNLRIPSWTRRPSGSREDAREVKKLLRRGQLKTVCEQARCPNICECFSRRTATFLLMGSRCTRHCPYCSIEDGVPNLEESSFAKEAESVALAAKELELKHVVLTSVTRDDLEDGGASSFVLTIKALRNIIPAVQVEVLVPDFRGAEKSATKVIDEHPDIFNHNLETVPRLYRKLRPGGDYEASLRLLSAAKAAGLSTKTGVMLGLGEGLEEVKRLIDEVAEIGIQSFTAGQYMRPTKGQVPVSRYLELGEFSVLSRYAKEKGIANVFVGPLVRSSYQADLRRAS